MVIAHRRFSVAALAGLVFGVAACGDSTGPGAGIDVTVSLMAMQGPSLSVGADSTPRIACTVDLRAAATGAGRATWADATMRIFAGKDRTRAVDSIVVPASTVQSAWGKPDIAVGETEESGAQLGANIPFGGEIRYRYRPDGGGIKTAPVSFDCGPKPSNATPPPVITTLTVEPPTGPVEPGDTIKVDYSATSGLGLWETTIALSGPCVAHWTIAEGLQQSVARVVSLAIPTTCRLGVPLALHVTAVDAAAQEALRSVAPGIALVDVTRPGVEALFFSPSGGSATDRIAGKYFVGDSLYFIFIASDNYALRTLVWEVTPAGFRDSLRVTGRSVGPWLKVPIRPDWIGPIQLRLFARDSVGLVSDTIVSAPDSLRVYPTVTRPTRVATVDGEVRALAIDSRRGVIYLAQGNQFRLAVLSLATMTVTATLPMPAVPTDVDLSAGGDSLLVALPYARGLGVIDLRRTPLALTLLPLTGLDTTTLDQGPWHLRVAVNGKAFVSLLGAVPSAYTLLDVDLGTGVQRLRTDAGDAGNVAGGLLERSRDASYLVMNGGAELFQSYDAASDAFGPRGSAIPYDWRPSVDPTGQHVAISLDLYDRSLQFVRRSESPILGGVISSDFSGDGLMLYQGAGIYGIVRSLVSDGTMLDRSLTPVAPWLVRTSPDGTNLVIVDSNCCSTSRIAVMDMR